MPKYQHVILSGRTLPSSNGTLVVGAMGGFATADIDFNASGSKARFEGPVFGAYASYINNKFGSSLFRMGSILIS